MSDLSVATRQARARRWTVDRRTRLVASLALGLVLVFTLLAFSLRGAAGTRLDLTVSTAIQSLNEPWLTWLMVAISLPGFAPWSWVCPVVLIGGFLLVRLRREALFLALTPGASLISGLTKMVVERPRPPADAVHVFARLLDYSYPSGHVVAYVSLYGFAFFLFFALFRPAWWRRLALIVFGLLLTLVGVSRIYLGQHWASDVLGGYALGTAYLLCLIELYQHSRPTPSPSPNRATDAHA